jgi:hypothetical protein
MTDGTQQKSRETRDVELEGLPRWVYWFVLGIMLLLAVLSLPQVASQWLACSGTWFWQSITGSEAAPGCLALNEFGDLLAGAFAPLAFGGLIYTVLMQRDELRAQRRELKISQDIASEQRAAMEKQQEALALQASIMEQTARLTNEQEARRDLDTFASMIRHMLTDFADGLVGHRNLTDHEFLKAFWPTARERANHFCNVLEAGGAIEGLKYYGAVRQIATETNITILSLIEKLPERLSGPDRALFLQYGMAEFVDTVRRFKMADSRDFDRTSNP